MLDVPRKDIKAMQEAREKVDALIDGPADRADDLDAALAELKGIKAKVAETGKRAIGNAARALFEKHPEIAAIQWRQYTPYFNDGDACEFSVHEPGVKLVDNDAAAVDGNDEDEDDDEEEYIESWSLGYCAEKAGKPKPESLMKDLKSFGELLEAAEDACKATFGDHARVTIRRGQDAEVEEYEHD